MKKICFLLSSVVVLNAFALSCPSPQDVLLVDGQYQVQVPGYPNLIWETGSLNRKNLPNHPAAISFSTLDKGGALDGQSAWICHYSPTGSFNFSSDIPLQLSQRMNGGFEPAPVAFPTDNHNWVQWYTTTAYICGSNGTYSEELCGNLTLATN